MSFQNPEAEYRGTPFWAWNTKMTPAIIDHMLDAFQEMGMGGAYMHSRTGMDIPYLSREFFDLIQYTHRAATKRGLLTCLYDEDRWASGFGGGFVTENHAFRRRFLVWSPISPEKFPDNAPCDTEGSVFSGERSPLGRYAVTLENGYLAKYRVLQSDDTLLDGESEWFAWLEVSGDCAWYNNQSYVDTLNPDAIRKFIEVTHEAYYRELGSDFGKTIPSIFSDEPAFPTMTRLASSDDRNYHTMPYTEAFEEKYRAAYGESFLEHLPEIFYLQPDGRMSQRSYRYHDLLCEMLVSAYCDQIGAWCQQHNIAFTGHMFREDELECETYALGEVMRCYRAFQIPGIDVLSDKRRINTAKQVQSAAHQFQRNRVTSELYGVTNWDFDFRGHKLAGDWQAALGITNRVHHLAWSSMRGAAKRDYPASIAFQSPWYRRYSMIEDYFARLNTVLTTGKPRVRIGVIHPIESYWLYWGPNSQTAEIRGDMDERFASITTWLLYGMLDFDFISEGLLRDMPTQQSHAKFDVGAMQYDVVVVPACHTLRSTTLERLQTYNQAGGHILFLEQKPFLVDALPDSRPNALSGEVLPYSRFALLRALEPYRILSIRDADGNRAQNMFSQWRDTDNESWLFLAHVYAPRNPDMPQEEKYAVSVVGTYRVEQWNALDGSKAPVPTRYADGKTLWDMAGYAHDSFLYRLIPSEECACEIHIPPVRECRTVAVPAKVSYTLEEPNVLVIDHAQYRIDDGAWHDSEEMLRIAKQARKALGLSAGGAQPWCIPETPPEHVLHLRCAIAAKQAFSARLALEDAKNCRIVWNGREIANTADGYYVDMAIDTLAEELHGVQGQNILEIDMPFGKRSFVENMFLLGNFGVSAVGQEAYITELPDALSFSDLTNQGLPFYGGNVVFHIPVCAEYASDLTVQTTFFRCPAIDVLLDDSYQGTIAFSPYTHTLRNIPSGAHTVSLRCYGNRMNTFGALHLSERNIAWRGPNMWDSIGAGWSDEYQLAETGLLKAPVLTESEAQTEEIQ